MFPTDTLVAYLLAVLLVVLAPGPDNILAVSRGLGQGRMAATLSSLGAGLGIMVHAVAATLGLTVILQTSPVAFWVVKLIGAAYLLWLGFKAITVRSLITFRASQALPLRRVLLSGLLSNVLNPKPGLFVVAFIPQFASAERGSVPAQMLAYGAIFAIVTAVMFSVMGAFASRLSAWLSHHPKVLAASNVAAGATFVAAAGSILLLGRKSAV